MKYHEFVSILRELGFQYHRAAKGTHEIWARQQHKITVRKGEINRMVARRELRDAGYQDWRRV